MTTSKVYFDDTLHFDYDTYCAARFRIERNKDIKSHLDMPQDDLEFVKKAILESSNPTSLSIWACLQPNLKVLFALHPYIASHMVKIATSGDPVLDAYMHMNDDIAAVYKARKNKAYEAFVSNYNISFGRADER